VQVVPDQLAPQAQLKETPSSVHFPEFWHGLPEQGSVKHKEMSWIILGNVKIPRKVILYDLENKNQTVKNFT
jgi:hypothetical protein